MSVLKENFPDLVDRATRLLDYMEVVDIVNTLRESNPSLNDGEWFLIMQAAKRTRARRMGT